MSSMSRTEIWGVPVFGSLGAWGRYRRQILPFVLVGVMGAVGACSTAGPSPGTQSVGTSAPARPAPPPELAGFCSAAPDLLQVLEEGPDISSTATPADVAVAIQKFSTQLQPPLTAVENSMPPVVRDDVGAIGRQVGSAVATKSDAPMSTPEFDAALTRLRINTIKQCEIPEVRIVSTEYEYEGMPANVVAGALSVIFINLGAEPHQMSVFRIADGESRPFAQLIALPQEQRDQLLTSVMPVPSADPGSTDAEILKLAPGRYGIACLNSQGSTVAKDGTGPSHASLGETAEFAVQ